MSANALGYVRVSTERQAGETVTSVQDQERAVRQLATKIGVEISTWYRDEGVSGSIAEERPGFGKMLAWCRANPRPTRTTGYVLVLNASRFGRFDDPDQAAALRYELRKLGWLVRFAESDDSEDVIARSVMRAVGDAQASEYRRNIIRNAQRGKRGAASQGFWTTHEPFGYRRRVVHPEGRDRVLAPGQKKASDEKVKLTLGPAAEVATVRWMFNAYAKGTHTLEEIANALMIRAPGRRWSRFGVRQMLANRTYRGAVVANRRSAVLWRQKIWRTDPSTWIVVEDAHPALIDATTFAAVQARLSISVPRRPRQVDYRVSGLVHCVHCREPYIGGGRSGSCTSGVHSHYYRDRGGHLRRICDGKMGTVSQKRLEEAVVSILAKEIGSGAVRAAIKREVLALEASSRRTSVPDRNHLQRELARAEAKRTRLVEAIAAGAITMDEGKTAMESTRELIEQMRSQLRPAPKHPQGAIASEAERWLAIAADFPLIAREATGNELRAMLRPWLDGATFDKYTRELVVRVRTVPLSLLKQSGLGQHHRSKDVVVRRVILARRRAA
jgi:DNA invertase Pin-like site-specific DNA recombinase